MPELFAEDHAMTDYAPHPTAPPMMAHQAAEFHASKDARIRALFWEPRTGKSRVVIDTASYLYDQNIITGVLIIAMPAGVPGNWSEDEIPKWLPPRIPRTILRWDRSKAGTKTYQEKLKEFLDFPGLTFVLINGEGILTEPFLKFARKFLAQRKCLVVGDETSLIAKNPGAARTKKFWAIGNHPNALYKRILDGTPAAESPLDYYSQWKFLDISVLGQPTFTTFKAHYAEWQMGADRAHREAVDSAVARAVDKGVDPEKARATAEIQLRRVGKTWPEIKGYQNLDELRERMSPYSSRIRFADVFDAPPKRYKFERYELSAEQQRVYQDLHNQYQAELRDGSTITAVMALTRYLRLQQILANYYPPERIAMICPACNADGCPACNDLGFIAETTPIKTIDPKQNPRIEALTACLQKGIPSVVWARFTYEIDSILSLAGALGICAVRYDGHTPTDAKQDAKDAFQHGQADIMVAQIKSAGRGIPLWRAEQLIYYSNTFSLSDRLQSEERGEAGHKKTSTMIIDLRAEGTIDDTITDAYRAKKGVADYVMGEQGGKWL